ncbi:DUF461 domain-containing protein [Streptomyces sp. NPDC048639]|uniref:DUF461 domain-containing protein n=1 Tax=Streptomyces sp. NPDC048639 TaxID=3365581 RepID=UPI003710260C
MSRSIRRGALAATAIAFSLAALTACGAGSSASTLQVKPDNAATHVGEIKIQNANVITQPEGSEGSAVIAAKIFNNGDKDQVLESVTVEGSREKVKLSPAKGTGPLTVPAGGALILGGEGNPSAVLATGNEAMRDGDVQDVVFDLSRTGEVELQAFVVPATHYFEGFGPTAVPTPSRSASPSTLPADGEDQEAEEGTSEDEEDELNGDDAGTQQSPAAGASASAGHATGGTSAGH